MNNSIRRMLLAGYCIIVVNATCTAKLYKPDGTFSGKEISRATFNRWLKEGLIQPSPATPMAYVASPTLTAPVLK